MHGSLKSAEVRKLAEEREKAEEEVERRRKKKYSKKDEMKGAFQRCKLKCLCGELKVCKATELKECSVCFDVLKMKCHKKACKNNDGELPEMICVASKKKKHLKRSEKKVLYIKVVTKVILKLKFTMKTEVIKTTSVKSQTTMMVEMEIKKCILFNLLEDMFRARIMKGFL